MMNPTLALSLLKSKGNPVSPEVLAKRLGMTVKELSAYVGDHQFNSLVEAGTFERERGTWPSDDELVRRLNAGETQVSIAAEVGRTPAAMSQHLKRRKLKDRLLSAQERRVRRWSGSKLCVDCGSAVSHGATRCRDCAGAARTRITWPGDDDLVEMVVGDTLNRTALKLRVSRAAIRDRLKRRGRWGDVLGWRQRRNGR